jgi:hypothetical protein
LKENLKPEEFNSSLGSQVFSPLRDVSAMGSPNISSNITPLPLQTSNLSRLSTDSILSPLRETSFNLNMVGIFLPFSKLFMAKITPLSGHLLVVKRTILA